MVSGGITDGRSFDKLVGRYVQPAEAYNLVGDDPFDEAHLLHVLHVTLDRLAAPRSTGNVAEVM